MSKKIALAQICLNCHKVMEVPGAFCSDACFDEMYNRVDRDVILANRQKKYDELTAEGGEYSKDNINELHSNVRNSDGEK